MGPINRDLSRASVIIRATEVRIALMKSNNRLSLDADVEVDDGHGSDGEDQNYKCEVLSPASRHYGTELEQVIDWKRWFSGARI